MQAHEPHPLSVTEDQLFAIIGRLHAKDPGDRFGSAAEVADLLGRHLSSPGGPPLPLPRRAPGGRRRRWAGRTVRTTCASTSAAASWSVARAGAAAPTCR